MKWKKIGRILLIDEKFEYSNKNELKNLLIEHDVDSIAKIKNISGQLRQPNIELLIGNKTETIHKENNCFFKLDISKIMWSKGNTSERMRIAKLVQNGEVIIDMFAGIGYFTIPIAVHSNPKKIFSIELNPISYNYLKENIDINTNKNKKLNIEAILGDCSQITPNLRGDRVIMGYVKTTHNYLDSAIQSLNKGGILHYHETVPEKIMNKRPIHRISQAAHRQDRDENIEVLNNKIIKKYSPGVVHIVVDARIY